MAVFTLLSQCLDSESFDNEIKKEIQLEIAQLLLIELSLMSIENCAAGQENDSDAVISFIRLLLTNDGNALRKGAAMDFFMSGLLVFSRFPSLYSRGPPE
jgi:hypothetical protein